MITKEKSYLNNVTIIRGIAAIGILLLHSEKELFPGFYVSDFNKSHFLNIPDLKGYILNILPFIFNGVNIDILIIMSGFAIHWGFMASGQLFNYRAFFSKRFWRLYPVYFIVLIVTCIIGKGGHYYFMSHAGLKDFLVHVFLIHNLFNKYIISINGTFWTMALEAQLYLLYPVFLFIRKKTSIARALQLTALVSVSFMGFEGVIFGHISSAVQSNAINFWFMWCSGAFLAEKFYLKEKVFKKAVIPLIMICWSLTVLSRFYLYTSVLSEPLMILTYFIAIEWILYTKMINLNAYVFKFLYYAGLCSYSVYLIHSPYYVIMFTRFHVYNSSFVFKGMADIPIVLLILCIAYVMYRYIETPFINLGKHFRKEQIAMNESVSLQIHSEAVDYQR